MQAPTTDTFDDDDEESFFESPYASGHWDWCHKENKLVFVSDIASLSAKPTYVPPVIVGPIEFRDNLDVLEQHKFRKIFQRKIDKEDDVVTLQDIKDLVLYTAPTALLSPMMVNVLHKPTTERFLRALILYCQYYGQISDIMAKRTEQRETKIYTCTSYKTEMKFCENLQDLRLLVTKEYSSMILGGADFQNFHHKGKQKKLTSLSRREGRLFESLIRLSVQIVWIALGRKRYNLIEIEVNRLFRSSKFNLAAHHAKIDTAARMSLRERQVFFGKCLQPTHKLKSHSPLLSEFHCDREIDYRLLGLGVVKYPELNLRLQYLETMLMTEESKLKEMKLSLGIMGLPRTGFDALLRGVHLPGNASKRPSVASFRLSGPRISARSSRTSTDQKQLNTIFNLQPKTYGDIVLPDGDIQTAPPDAFPSERQPPLIINRQQHKKWLNRSNRLASKLASKRYKTLLGKQGTLLDKEKVHTEAYKESGESESGEERTMEAFQTNAFHCSQLKFTVEP
ncbi:uncharacterized protein LOC113235326 [Hyposmocoma kahamanoa]|uniref:uncharacterized protein LOC113235326 n=1 Tax=Hyposmocoma kahamanoa TaxID=1477025 RepID=UPI000E6D9426|nr:uncharacterized protein LOC113235326 [Hyposmocoma kahamanoa]